jgi:hypothetical protein
MGCEEKGMASPRFFGPIKLTPRVGEWYVMGQEKAMQDTYRIILEAEESFARTVALGVVVKKPLTAWHFIIPGMFIFDFLRRNSETRKYGELFLFPRKSALHGALDVLEGDDRKQVLSLVGEDIRQWLMSLKLYSERLLCGHMEQICLLMEHYIKLFQVEGKCYPELVRNAYKTHDQFMGYLQRLATAEQEVDGAVTEIHGGTPEISERLRAEQVQVEALRKKEVERIF